MTLQQDTTYSGPSGWLGLEGRRALVTGGTRNIGRAIAEGLADAGADVAVLGGRDEDALADTLAELSRRPVKAVGAIQPLDDVPGVLRTAQRFAEELGGIDILVNNAAIRPHAPLETITVEEWDKVIAVNLRAPFLLAQALLPQMKERRFGRILNFSGMDAYWGRHSRAHVTSSKGGIVGLSRALASECCRDGVTVNTIVPGSIDTERHTPQWYPNAEERWQRRRDRIPMGRLGEIREVADVALFLASPRASYLTGHEFFVSGGGHPLVHE
jgi:3-oxoacyl-[acyl-carrier protein] reductase